jgi:hypothetical protein
MSKSVAIKHAPNRHFKVMRGQQSQWLFMRASLDLVEQDLALGDLETPSNKPR